MNDDITVKFISSKSIYIDHHATRQFPDGVHQWGQVKFIFDIDCQEYDWLVVYHDIPKNPGSIELHCPRENTVFITHEPSAIKYYGSDFAAQFGWLLSCHEAWALPHKNRIGMPPGSIWIYGGDFYDVSARGQYDYNTLHSTPPPAKTKVISTVCSDKAMKHTMHYRRFTFTQQLKQQLPQMDVFGHGVRLIKQKADALDDYRYHLTIENDICPHYWTEKLSDAFLGYTLPLYCGCPNAEEYFPPLSFIRVDINDSQAAANIIKEAIANDEYSKRLPHIIEARRRVLEEHNLYAMVARTIRNLPAENNDSHRGYLHRRYRLMQKNPLVAVRYLAKKLNNQLRIARNQRSE